MTSSKFSVSRATRSTLYSLSSPFHKSSSNLSEIFDRSHKPDSAASGSSSKDTSVESVDPPTPLVPAKDRQPDMAGVPAAAEEQQEEEDEDETSSRGREDSEYTPSTSSAPSSAVVDVETTEAQSGKTLTAAVPTSTGSTAESPAEEQMPKPNKLVKEQGSADAPVLRPRPSPKKTKTWAGRLSVFLPALISPSADQHSPSIHRKPLPTASNNTSPTDTDTAPSGLGIRTSATFDVVLTPNSDPRLHQPLESSAPQYAPPPLPPKPQGRETTGRRPSWSAHPPIPPPKLVNDEMPALPYREAPNLPPRPVDPEPQGGARLKKERRHSPPTMAPPVAPPREQISPPTPEQTLNPGKLRKENTEPKPRSNSLQQGGRRPSFPLLGVQGRSTSPSPDARGRSSSVQPFGVHGGTRVVSNSNSATSQSPSRDEKRGRIRRSWLPGGRSRSNSQDMTGGQNAQAWVLGSEPAGDYKTSFLLSGDKVPELWNESGSVYVYLFPRNQGLGPSFKVPVYAVSSSQAFNDLIQAEATPGSGGSGSRSRARSFTGRNSLTVDDAARIPQFTPSGSPPLDGSESPGDVRLYIPGTQGTQLAAPGQRPQEQPSDLERLIAIRNLFAFLTGQPLVGTKANPTVFRAFLQISMLLQEFGFTNLDGSSFGEAVDMSFDFFSNQLLLSDVRHSREKTIEALILGERMKSMDLYNEAFAHAVGKYTAIMDLRSPLFEQVSPQTRQKLERAHLDLVNRQHNVNIKLEQFDFPSLFSGIANSTSIDEVKSVRFNKWRASFNKMRQFVLGYYKSTFGNWPPKASSKKNPFSESGLNRLVLKALYSDMCAMYDLLVDRDSLTTRVVEGGDDDDESSAEQAIISALRKVLTEFDTSTPPVLPPIPFDAPQVPSMRAILETYDRMSAKDKLKFDKRIKEHELILVLHKAYNYDTNTLKIPFLAEFKDFENHEAKGKSAADIADQRIGYWLFLYVVIQSLPMLVVDAPGLKHVEGVEYFLCEPPMGNPPWLEDSRQVRKMWYEISGGAGYVELSADSVTFSVEAIYHRSHCWAAAKIWEGAKMGDMPPPVTEPVMSPLAPPPMFTNQDGSVPSPPSLPGADPSPPPGSPKYVGRPRTNSPGGRTLAARNSTYRSSIAIGLEPVPMGGMPGDRASRIVSVGSNVSLPSMAGLPRSASATNLLAAQPPPAPEPASSTMTFDDILSGTQPTKTKKKNRFF